MHRDAPFIVLEGIDGAGTTTQTARLCERLRSVGREALQTREPTDGKIGRLIRELLSADADRARPFDRRALAMLFAADRIDHLHGEIDPACSAGTVVVSDRYILSSLAYQALALPRAIVADLNRFARAPSLTLLLRIDADRAAARRHARGGTEEIFDDLVTQRQLVINYDAEAAQARDRGERLVVIDAAEPVDEVAAAVWRAVESIL